MRKFDPRNQTLRDYISDNILKEFLNQLPWKKDQLLRDEYKDIVKLDQITDATIKIKKGTMSGRFFVAMLAQLPVFEFENHMYRYWLSNFTRETIPVKKHINKWPTFHVKKILRQVKAAV